MGLAIGQETCMNESAQLCAMVDEKLDYHQKFYSALNEGFKESLKDSEMKDFIKRNFRRHRGDLELDTDFNRGGWFLWYRRILNKHDIHSCADLATFEADKKLIQSCNEILNRVLYENLPNESQLRAIKILRKVKTGIEAEYANTADGDIVRRTLGSILDTPLVDRDLVRLDTEFIKLEKVCRHSSPIWECALYGQSNKEALSIGGNIFFSDTTLEAIIAKAVAQKVAQALHGRLEDRRFELFASLFYKKLEESHFEKIISKIQQKVPLTISANTYLVLREYYSEQREFAPEILKLKAGYYCYEDKRAGGTTDIDSRAYYSRPFNSIHRVDKVAILLCQNGLISSDATAFNYDTDWLDLQI